MSIGKIQIAAIASTTLALLASASHMLFSLGSARLAAAGYAEVPPGHVGSAPLILLLLPPIPCNLWLAIKSRSQTAPFVFASAALALMLATLAILFIWVLPAHQGTILFATVETLRTPWEYADAESGVLGAIALGSVIGARLCWQDAAYAMRLSA